MWTCDKLFGLLLCVYARNCALAPSLLLLQRCRIQHSPPLAQASFAIPAVAVAVANDDQKLQYVSVRWVLRWYRTVRTQSLIGVIRLCLGRTSRGERGAERGCSPMSWAKSIFLGQSLNFSGRRQQPKMNKKILFQTKTWNSFHQARQSARNPIFLPLIIGWVSRSK